MEKGNPNRWRDPVLFCSEVLCDPESGKPFVLYDAEVDFLRRALERQPDGRMRFTELAFCGPKKSGKTAFAAMIGIYTAVVLSPANGEIYLLANDLDQSASRVFKAIAQILEASPYLRDSFDISISTNRITFRASGTTITALPSDYRGFAGANPTLNIYDESAYYTSENARRLWDEGVPSPARTVSFRLSVSTAGFEGEPSPLRDLYDRAMQHGVEVAPDTRVHENALVYWSHDCKAPWQSEAWQSEMQRTLRAAQFRRLIRNEWTASEGTFIELSQWDACVDLTARPLMSSPNLSVWSALDLGLKHDSTAIVTVARSNDYLRLIDHKIFVPVAGQTLDIEATAEREIRNLKQRFNLQSVSFDPWQGIALAQRLTRAGVRMTEFTQSVPNLTQMAGTLLDVIKNRQIVLYPSDELRNAVAKTIAIESSRGWRLGKAKSSDRVDPVIALAMAVLAATEAPQQHHMIVQELMSGRRIFDSAKKGGHVSATTIDPNAKSNTCAGAGCGILLSMSSGREVSIENKVVKLCAVCYANWAGRPGDFLRFKRG